MRYTSLQNVRDEGVTVAQASDSRILSAIERASNFIDTITGQAFYPFEGDLYCDGRESALVAAESMLPIIRLDEVEILSARTRSEQPIFEPFVNGVVEAYDYCTPSGIIDDDLYSISLSRYVELLGGKFPRGARNVRLHGVFGWLQAGKAFTTTTETDIDPGDVAVTLVSVVGLEVRDFLSVAGKVVLVTGIDYTTGEVDFEPCTIIDATIALGAEAKSYGACPLDIERVATYMAIQWSRKMAPAQAGLPSDQIGTPPTLFKSESTDNYSYSRFAPDELSPDGTTGKVTGSVEMDMILAQYSRPPKVGVV